MIDDKMISFEYASNALRKLTGKASQTHIKSLEAVPSEIEPDSRSWLTKLIDKFFKR